jgi:hypothetical protein
VAENLFSELCQTHPLAEGGEGAATPNSLLIRDASGVGFAANPPAEPALRPAQAAPRTRIGEADRAVLPAAPSGAASPQHRHQNRVLAKTSRTAVRIQRCCGGSLSPPRSLPPRPAARVGGPRACPPGPPRRGGTRPTAYRARCRSRGLEKRCTMRPYLSIRSFMSRPNTQGNIVPAAATPSPASTG